MLDFKRLGRRIELKNIKTMFSATRINVPRRHASEYVDVIIEPEGHYKKFELINTKPYVKEKKLVSLLTWLVSWLIKTKSARQI